MQDNKIMSFHPSWLHNTARLTFSLLSAQTQTAIISPTEADWMYNFQGICEGLMYEEIQEQYPEEFAARDQNKYSYR